MRVDRSSLAGLARQHGLAAALLGAAAIGVPASQQGAYFPPAWGWSGFGLLLAAALALKLTVAAAEARHPPPGGR